MHRSIPILLATLCLAGTAEAASAVAFPGGRIAISHDGQKDPDDLLSAPMDMALLQAAGLAGRVVHFDYLDQIGVYNKDLWTGKMERNCLEGARRFGLDQRRLFNCLKADQLAAAIANFAAEGNRSSASDPLWFICSGPMEMPWRCINAVDPAKRQYIHCISHSRANNEHLAGSEISHTWADLGRLGAQLHYQESGGLWDEPKSTFAWMKTASADLAWVYGCNVKDSFDSSDSVSTYWLISGGPAGGTWSSGVAEAKALLTGTEPPPTSTNERPTVSAGPDQTVILEDAVVVVLLDGTAADDGLPSGVLKTVWSMTNGPAPVVFADRTAVDTTVTITAPGIHTFKLIAKDSALSAYDKMTVTVLAAPTGAG